MAICPSLKIRSTFAAGRKAQWAILGADAHPVQLSEVKGFPKAGCITSELGQACLQEGKNNSPGQAVLGAINLFKLGEDKVLADVKVFFAKEKHPF